MVGLKRRKKYWVKVIGHDMIHLQLNGRHVPRSEDMEVEDYGRN